MTPPEGPTTPAPLDQAKASAERPRRRRRSRIAAIVIGVAAAAVIALLATRPSSATTVVSSPLLGKPAPDIGGPTLIKKKKEKYENKVKIVDERKE